MPLGGGGGLNWKGRGAGPSQGADPPGIKASVRAGELYPKSTEIGGSFGLGRRCLGAFDLALPPGGMFWGGDNWFGVSIPPIGA